MAEFLTNHRQAVGVGAGMSGWASVQSGDPQESVLGPLMSLIFIGDLGDDLPADTKTKLLKYVDDTKAIHPVSSVEDVEEFQGSLGALYWWQALNNMEWNGTKFVSLRLGPRLDIIEDTLLFTPDFGAPISEEAVTKDLGILIDNKADFRPQRAAVVAKTAAMAAWVL